MVAGAIWMATPRRWLAELRAAIRRYDTVQRQHVRCHDSIVDMVLARFSDLGTKHHRFDPFPRVRLPCLYRDMSHTLGVETKEHLLVGRVHESAGLHGIHGLGAICHRLAGTAKH